MWLYAIHIAIGCSSSKGRAAVEQEISGWVAGLPFGRGIRANVSILSWIFFIGWGLTSVSSCFFKRPAAVSYIVFTGNVARSAPCVLAGAVCYSSIVVDHLPHPVSTRPAVSWSTFLPYLLYHPLGGHATRARARSGPGRSSVALCKTTLKKKKKKKANATSETTDERAFMEHLQPMLINGVSDS